MVPGGGWSVFKDENGNVHGKLTVLEQAGKTKGGMAQWLCQCECGNQVVVAGGNLRSGNSRSCGCAVRFKPLPHGIAAKNELLCNYKAQANLRGIEWRLTRRQFFTLTQQPCHYCGAPPLQKARARSNNTGIYLYNGIDRVDNSLGYRPDNVVPCCGTCNRAKMDMNYQDFLAWVAAVYEHKACAIVSA